MIRNAKRNVGLAVLLVLAAATAWSTEPPNQAKVGEKAPDFTLMDQNGNQVSLSDYADKTVVLEWTNPDCPFVKRHYKAETMKKLSEKYKSKDVVWLAINSTNYADVKANQKWVEKKGLDYAVLDDHEGKVGALYGARTTPHMFIVDKGVLAYAGAIDDDPSGSGATVNYVDQALDQVCGDHAVTTAQTKPYGCSVKYAKN